MRKNSIKNTRINGEVQKELSNIIRNEIKDPRIGMMTSVTAAEVAPDLKTCKVYISVFGDDEAKKETIRGLKSAEGFIRRMLAKTINLRNTPELTFVLDESIEYGVTMSKLIDEVTHKEDKKDEENEIINKGSKFSAVSNFASGGKSKRIKSTRSRCYKFNSWSA